MEEAYLQILKASDSGTGFSFNTYLGTDYNPPQNLGRPAFASFLLSLCSTSGCTCLHAWKEFVHTSVTEDLCLVANRTHVYVFNETVANQETVLNWLPPPDPGLSADGADRKLS